MSARELAPVARLFGELLLRELTPERLEELRQPEVASAFVEIGLPLPAAAQLEELAAQFFERFLNPQRGYPLVQSLYQGGSYEGDAATGVRQVAAAAGVALDAESARGAPVDHLGAELCLWAHIVERDEEAAAEFARRHLSWAPPILQRSAATDGAAEHVFSYARLSTVAAQLIDSIGEFDEA